MIFWQIVIAALLSPIILGPAATMTSVGGPNILLITLWLFIWLCDRHESLRFALIIGLILDFVSFLPFGFWTIQLVALTYAFDYLKNHYLVSSSLLHSSVALGLMVGISGLINYFATQQSNGYYLVINILSSVILGQVVYYLLAVRLRLFSRWAGKRI